LNESEDNGEKSTEPSQHEMLKPLSVRKVRLKVNRFLMPASRKDVVPHYFTANQVKFLEAYAETLDIDMACERAGITKNSVKKSPYLAEEIKFINQASMFKHRAAAALGTHLRLMDKFEREFDTSWDPKVKSSMASNLAKMSEASMRASGEFSERVENTGISGVQVVINIGDGKEVKSVEGTVIDVQPG
jgi:hypothetical protein